MVTGLKGVSFEDLLCEVSRRAKIATKCWCLRCRLNQEGSRPLTHTPLYTHHLSSAAACSTFAWGEVSCGTTDPHSGFCHPVLFFPPGPHVQKNRFLWVCVSVCVCPVTQPADWHGQFRKFKALSNLLLILGEISSSTALRTRPAERCSE